MDGKKRANIKPGCEVTIVLKADQRAGILTHGKVKDIAKFSLFRTKKPDSYAPPTSIHPPQRFTCQPRFCNSSINRSR